MHWEKHIFVEYSEQAWTKLLKAALKKLVMIEPALTYPLQCLILKSLFPYWLLLVQCSSVAQLISHFSMLVPCSFKKPAENKRTSSFKKAR